MKMRFGPFTQRQHAAHGGRGTGYPEMFVPPGKVHFKTLILGMGSETLQGLVFKLAKVVPLWQDWRKPLMASLILYIFKQIFSGVTDEAASKEQLPALQLGCGLLPVGLPANPEVLYSLSLSVPIATVSLCLFNVFELQLRCCN